MADRTLVRFLTKFVSSHIQSLKPKALYTHCMFFGCKLACSRYYVNTLYFHPVYPVCLMWWLPPDLGLLWVSSWLREILI